MRGRRFGPTYPVFLNIQGRQALVVGGGKVAEKKVRGLLQAGARVRVISPRAVLPLARMAAKRRIVWTRKKFKSLPKTGLRLVIAATDDAAVNLAVSRQASRRGLLCNVVDQAWLSSFIAPSVGRKAGFTIAVGTGGASPLLAARVRREVLALVARRYGRLLQAMARARDKARKGISSVQGRKGYLRSLLGRSRIPPLK